MKNLPEDFPTFGSSCNQEFLKIPLCDHRDLGKLLIVKTHKFRYRLCHCPHFRNRLTFVGIKELRICLFCCKSGSTFLLGLIFRISTNFIFFSLVGEGQFYECFCLCLCVFAAEHSGFPHSPTRFPIQGKCDCVKDRCLTGTCIPRNQVEPVFSKFFKINRALSRIGAKSTDHQFFWLHSFISRINFSANSSCCFIIGRLF